MTTWLRIARCTEDLTLDFEPGVILGSLADVILIGGRELTLS